MILAGSSNRMLIDPRWGLAMGNNQLFTNAEGTTVIVPNFIDENDNLIFEDTWCNGLMPKNSHFYVDINSGDVYMAGTVYATEGYFAGEIQANTGEIGGLSIDSSGIHGNGIDISSSGIGTGGITLGNGKFALGNNLKYESNTLNVEGNIKCTSLDCTNATVTGLTVGDNVTMGDNVTISWSNVSDTPTIPSKVSQLTNDSGYVNTSSVTTITKDTISTSLIRADQIEVGYICSGTIGNPDGDPLDLGECCLDLGATNTLRFEASLQGGIEIAAKTKTHIWGGGAEIRLGDTFTGHPHSIVLQADSSYSDDNNLGGVGIHGGSLYMPDISAAIETSTKKRVLCIGNTYGKVCYVDLDTAIDQIKGSGTTVAVFG